MRQVKIIEGNCFDTIDLEEEVNKVFGKISENGYQLGQTKYCISKDGYVRSVVIEYEK